MSPRRLLVVGWDGATWTALDPLLTAGKLPHLARLLATGARARLRSTIPAVTPAAWTSIATGLDPGATGVLGFRHLDLRRRGGWSPTLAGAGDLRGRTLFEHAAGSGLGVACLAFPMTWPPFPLPGGVLLSGWPRPETPTAPALPASFAAELGPWAPGPVRPADPAITSDGRRDLVAAATERDARTHRAALHALATREDAITAAVYQSPDHIAHHFWGRPELAQGYMQADRWLGELRDAVGADAAVVLVSDHGFGPGPTRAVHLGRLLAQAGLLRRSDRGRSVVAASVRGAQGAVPTGHRKALRDRLPAAVRRWAWERSRGLDRIDASATVAIPAPLYGPWEGIVVQVQGRQRGGCVPPAKWSEVREQVRRALLDAGEAGAPIKHVHRREEIWRGPRLGELPDLVVELEADCAAGPRCDRGPIVTPRSRSEGEGSHRRHGVAVFGGAGFAQVSELLTVEPVDVLPTAFATIGLGVPASITGLARLDLLDAPPPPRTGRARSVSRVDLPNDDPGRVGLEAQLRDLGYME